MPAGAEILGLAIQKANSLDQDKVLAALHQLDILTVGGPFKAAADGSNDKANVLIGQNAKDEYEVSCAFFVMRTRSDLPYDFFSGERRDVLRPNGEGFRLARRTVLIDQTVLKAYNLSIFF